MVNTNKNLKQELKRGLRETRGPFFGSIDVFFGQAMQFLQRKASKLTLWRFVEDRVSLLSRLELGRSRPSDPKFECVVVGDNTTFHR